MYVNSTTNNDILQKEKNGRYVDLNSNGYFNEELNKNREKTQIEPIEVKRSDDELLEDIYSLLRTGLTKAEIEELEKLKEQILKEIEQQEINATEKGIKKIQDLIDKLNSMILQLKKRVTGVAIKESANKEEVPSMDGLKTSIKDDKSMDVVSNLQVLKDSVDESAENIKELKEIQVETKQGATIQEELYLMEKFKKS